MIDLHCHILPAVDDGATSLDDAIAMARIAVEEGITDVFATPHAFDGVYEVSPAVARSALTDLRAALEREGVPLVVHLGAECRIDERLVDGTANVPTLGQSSFVLVELPPNLVPPRFEATLLRLKAMTLRPILAHPERNSELWEKGAVDRVASWVNWGLLVQVTAGSFTGAFGKRASSLAAELAREGLCHFVATDAHSTTVRAPRLTEARRALERVAGADVAERLLVGNPRWVLDASERRSPTPLTGSGPRNTVVAVNCK